jgi:hypothetical protein
VPRAITTPALRGHARVPGYVACPNLVARTERAGRRALPISRFGEVSASSH